MLANGAIVVEGTPNVTDEVIRLARRVGYAHPTNFGTIFDVESRPDPNNSYTAAGLDLHTDLPNWANPPDFQFLQPAGGNPIQQLDSPRRPIRRRAVLRRLSRLVASVARFHSRCVIPARGRRDGLLRQLPHPAWSRRVRPAVGAATPAGLLCRSRHGREPPATPIARVGPRSAAYRRSAAWCTRLRGTAAPVR